MYVLHDKSVCTSICMCVSYDRFVCPSVCTCKCMYVSHDRSVCPSICMYVYITWLDYPFLCMYRLIHVDDHHSGHTDNKVDFSRADKVSLVVKYVHVVLWVSKRYTIS